MELNERYRLLLDMNCCHLKKFLIAKGFQCASVYDLLTGGHEVRTDYAMILYAKAHDLVILTSDEEVIAASEEVGDFKCIRVIPFSTAAQVEAVIQALGRIREPENAEY